jgi:hypothetical protein
MEKAIKTKLITINSKLLTTENYQSGFQAGVSTQKNLSIVLGKICKSSRAKKHKQIFISCDLQKAFDSVKRAKLLKCLEQKATSPEDFHII